MPTFAVWQFGIVVWATGEGAVIAAPSRVQVAKPSPLPRASAEKGRCPGRGWADADEPSLPAPLLAQGEGEL